ncbi:MAG: hypothetical protein B7Y56_10740 [Gallionellales bacterium 35-53-114]|jgi:Spy/CpxP family protein refolding chaperone|nr:MAG: hypothetical protein B7Y56_10740 [Gallionellales bacterium 35-53-114]OYZ64899.1 MAG: hypothetical protein B7Y04_03860 [Gallionellales bacterium 24-53-125]OZB07563.1 MAG: hypothetical protein B7X61_13155 [Gallionellales bacterium 39-52-133]HQS58758.1 periplasmic heavy metal sensor [Gallionellaceae bacterium]HQS75098.1 periplasmic heavy metal sensor [Gallionellaceae bacterium]
MKNKTGFWIALWLVLVIVTGLLAFGHGYGGRSYGPGFGWGHMGGWQGNYSEEGASNWRGYGPGMMGGAETGYGWGMGNSHGFMGRYGQSGDADGMMPGWPRNLTQEQAKKIGPLQSEAEKAQLNLRQQSRELQSRLDSLYASDKRDWNAIRAGVKALSDLQRQQMDAAIEMQQKMDGLLTDNQRQEVARAWHGQGWMRGQ